jgi:hypothetical protein
MDTACDRYQLRRRPEPEYWPGGIKPVLKLPEAPKQNVYRKGMAPTEYFNALCAAEAGEFIFKKATQVQSIYQIRPRLPATSYELRDRLVMEDPYGYTEQDATDPELNYLGIAPYHYFETPRVHHARFGSLSSKSRRNFRDPSYFLDPPTEKSIARYAGLEQKEVKNITRSFSAVVGSRYGYTWRGISRYLDRQNGIAGGETIVVDLKNNEVLAIWRGFVKNRAMTISGPTISWESAPACPTLPHGKFSKDFIQYFLMRVLAPSAN